MSLLETARAWADADPHDGDRAEIEALIEAGNEAEPFAEALVEVYGEPDPADPVHARVGGEYTLPSFDAEHVGARE